MGEEILGAFEPDAQNFFLGSGSEEAMELKDLDQAGTAKMTGRQLMESGLPIAITNSPGSVLIKYRQVDK